MFQRFFHTLRLTNRSGRVYDTSVVCGIGISFLFIMTAVLFSGEALRFMSFAGLTIVLGGVFGATLLHHLPQDLADARSAFQKVLYVQQKPTIAERMRYLSRLSQLIKDSGMVVLDREATRTDDSFLKLALELAADGLAKADIERVLTNEMSSVREREERGIAVFETLGGYAPAMGLIGTIIGLVQMLGNLGNADQIGPAMSVALLTTLYGAVLSNLVFLPFAGKIRRQADQDLKLKEVSLEAILSLAQEENPVMLRQKMKSFEALGGQR